MSTQTFPRNIQELAAYFVRAIQWLIDNTTRLGISETDMEELNALYGPATTAGTYLYWKKQYDEASNRKDSVITTSLNSVSEKVIAKLMKIYADIPASKWTDEDREKLNRKTGLPHEPTKPEGKIEAACVISIKPFPDGVFEISARVDEESNRGGIPEDANSLEIAYAIVESPVRAVSEDLPKVKKECLGPEDDTMRQISTKARTELKIEEVYAGYNVVCWGRWVNTHYPELAGKWSGRQTSMITML
jgi:hypothetical protein